MNRNITLILAALAVGLAIAASFWPSPGAVSKDLRSDVLLLPNLGERVDNLRRVEIVQNGETVVDIQLDESGSGVWRLRNMHDFPANFHALDDLLYGLSKMYIETEKTALPERHALLGLDEAQGAARVRVSGDVGTIAEVVLGNTSTSGKNQYVRLADGPQTWQVDSVVNLSTALADWIKQEILSIDPGRVQRVHFSDGNTLSRSGTSVPMDLKPMPAGKRISYSRALDSYARGLSAVRATRALPAAQITASIVQRSVEFTTFDHLVARAEQILQDGVPIWRLAFSLGDGLDGEANPESLKERTAEIDQLNAQHAMWAYAIASDTLRQWELSLSSVLSDIEPPDGGGN